MWPLLSVDQSYPNRNGGACRSANGGSRVSSVRTLKGGGASRIAVAQRRNLDCEWGAEYRSASGMRNKNSVGPVRRMCKADIGQATIRSYVDRSSCRPRLSRIYGLRHQPSVPQNF
uniref:Uncharacterized protein n=1 Tax=Hyaloperonospora arabidopsidis (strain Emoy2) TaxID=559515 RepID=M4B859_HYAAE